MVAEQVFVAPAHEHRGIGHRLLAHAEGYAIAEHARVLSIVVERDNWRARAFYGRLGYVPVQPELVELVLPGAE
jgi:ribosomal protein S18 acetylase RimI-like enzyme